MAAVSGDPEYLKIVDELRDLHHLKSGGYGTGEDAFANFSAIAAVKSQPRFVYPVDRDFEKSIRCYSLLAQGRVSEIEEELLDKASLMVCAAAMLRADR